MAVTPSTMLELGTPAPDFRLRDVRTGQMVSPSDFQAPPALLIVFMCTHCPYVRHIRERLAELIREYQKKGLAVLAINSNSLETHPQDGPVHMIEEADTLGYTFPYLFDETQAVAKAYRAACTPDFFLFGPDRRLVYRGQFDESRPGNNVPVTGRDLANAIEAVLEGRPLPAEQKPSMGCNIKWTPGSEPDYYG
jgi:peroxiredoxin